MARDWNPARHPRWPRGTGRGGQFRGTTGQPNEFFSIADHIRATEMGKPPKTKDLGKTLARNTGRWPEKRTVTGLTAEGGNVSRNESRPSPFRKAAVDSSANELEEALYDGATEEADADIAIGEPDWDAAYEKALDRMMGNGDYDAILDRGMKQAGLDPNDDAQRQQFEAEVMAEVFKENPIVRKLAGGSEPVGPSPLDELYDDTPGGHWAADWRREGIGEVKRIVDSGGTEDDILKAIAKAREASLKRDAAGIYQRGRGGFNRGKQARFEAERWRGRLRGMEEALEVWRHS
jgi:hypothetical protein